MNFSGPEEVQYLCRILQQIRNKRLLSVIKHIVLHNSAQTLAMLSVLKPHNMALTYVYIALLLKYVTYCVKKDAENVF